MTHGFHIPKTSLDVAVETLSPFPSAKHALPRWKCVLRYCEKFKNCHIHSRISQVWHKHVSKNIFHVYRLLSQFSVHGICPYKEEKYVYCVTQFHKQIQKKLCLWRHLFKIHKNFYIQYIQILTTCVHPRYP